MVDIALDVGKGCSVKIAVSVSWRKVTPHAIVDTGFVRNGLGLILPADTLPANHVKGIVKLTLADGEEVPARYLPVAMITRIGDYELPAPFETGVAFLGKERTLLGFDVIRRGLLTLDGPGKKASFALP
jgi:hypothetical protein